jgi:hypothetical protein
MDNERQNCGIEEAASRGADAGLIHGVLDQAAATARDDRLRLRLALVYPVVIAALAILGTLWTTATNDRLIRDLEESFREPPISAASTWWPIVSPTVSVLGGVGIVAAGLITAWIVRLGRSVGCHAGQAVQCEVLAELAPTDVAAEDRKRLATEIVGSLLPLDAVADSWSPLVVVAEQEVDIDRRAANLRATASFYRALDARERRKASRLVPIAGSLIAGIAVLSYGVALFHPLAGLFDSLAAAHEPIGHEGER